MSPRVLVVDDAPFIVTGLQVFLENKGMQVVSTGSGEKAVNIRQDNPGSTVAALTRGRSR